MGNPQNVDQEIAAKEQELEDLKRKKSDASIQKYPTWVTDPNDPSKGFIVQNAEEEAAVKKGLAAGVSGKTFEKTPEEQEAERLARAEADKSAAGAKSRLAGAESAKGKGKK